MKAKHIFLIPAAVFAVISAVASEILHDLKMSIVAAILCVGCVAAAILFSFKEPMPPDNNDDEAYSLDPDKERDTLLGNWVLLLLISILAASCSQTPSNAIPDNAPVFTTDSLHRGANPNLNATPEF